MELDGAQEKKSEKPATPGLSGNKKPQLKPVGVGVLVEAAGIEPASASTPPQALHAYPALLI
jgi:hypothetical protein